MIRQLTSFKEYNCVILPALLQPQHPGYAQHPGGKFIIIFPQSLGSDRLRDLKANIIHRVFGMHIKKSTVIIAQFTHTIYTV